MNDVTGLGLVTDPDVLMIADFMQAHVRATRLIGVAQSLALIAPALWSQHSPSDEVAPLRIAGLPISAGDLRTRSISTGLEQVHSGAGDDSGEGVV